MLAVALANMAADSDERIASATLFAAQVDFTYAGDLKVFIDEEQVEAIEQRMAERGYLEGGSMVTVFNLLRSNDLIWPYVINNYLRGKAPFPFDLLYWNSDATRLPAANHSFYMRNCYLDNKLTKGKMVIGNTPIDLKSVKVPIYNLATREDHIAPAEIGAARLQIFRRPGALRAVRLRPHRRRGQPAGQDRNISTGPGRGRAAPTSTAGWPRRRNIRAHGGRTGWTWLKRRPRPKCPRASPATARSRRSRTRRGVM